MRHGLCGDLGFSSTDRRENIRRIGEVVKLLMEAGVIVLASFISPFRADRRWVKDLVGASDFVEIYCKCPIDVCAQRDGKGVYKKAKAGLIKDFTGISSPYEAPENPDLVMDTSSHTIETCLDILVNHLNLPPLPLREG